MAVDVKELERRVQELMTQTLTLPPERKVPVMKAWLRSQPPEVRALCTQLIELGISTSRASASAQPHPAPAPHPASAVLPQPSSSGLPFPKQEGSAARAAIIAAIIGGVFVIAVPVIQSCIDDKDKKPAAPTVNVTQIVSQGLGQTVPSAVATTNTPPMTSGSSAPAPSATLRRSSTAR